LQLGGYPAFLSASDFSCKSTASTRLMLSVALLVQIAALWPLSGYSFFITSSPIQRDINFLGGSFFDLLGIGIRRFLLISIMGIPSRLTRSIIKRVKPLVGREPHPNPHSYISPIWRNNNGANI
jgi:hypothetical protein